MRVLPKELSSKMVSADGRPQRPIFVPWRVMFLLLQLPFAISTTYFIQPRFMNKERRVYDVFTLIFQPVSLFALACQAHLCADEVYFVPPFYKSFWNWHFAVWFYSQMLTVYATYPTDATLTFVARYIFVTISWVLCYAGAKKLMLLLWSRFQYRLLFQQSVFLSTALGFFVMMSYLLFGNLCCLLQANALTDPYSANKMCQVQIWGSVSMSDSLVFWTVIKIFITEFQSFSVFDFFNFSVPKHLMLAGGLASLAFVLSLFVFSGKDVQQRSGADAGADEAAGSGTAVLSQWVQYAWLGSLSLWQLAIMIVVYKTDGHGKGLEPLPPITYTIVDGERRSNAKSEGLRQVDVFSLIE